MKILVPTTKPSFTKYIGLYYTYFGAHKLYKNGTGHELVLKEGQWYELVNK